MQTRFLAAASGACAVLGLALLALRPAVARSVDGLAPPGVPPRPLVASAAASARHFHDTPCAGPGATLARPDRDSPSPELRAQLALTIGDPRRRAQELTEALAAWAQSDAGDALVWLARHAEQDAAPLLAAIGEGLAADPAGSTFALSLLSQDPEFGAQLAGPLVRTLAEQGRPSAAARLACATPANWTHEWATIAFATLAFEDPAAALASLDLLERPDLQRTATAALIAGWAASSPADLARHAARFPQESARQLALATALASWAEQDPEAAAAFASAPTPRS